MAAIGTIEYWQHRAEQAEALARTLQAQRDQAEADAAAMRRLLDVITRAGDVDSARSVAAAMLRRVGAGIARPTVVCLCGSTRFWREFQAAGLRETMAGKIVLSIGAASGTDDEHFGNLPKEEYDRVKTMLDTLHLRKIDLADEVLILNVGGYIGESTARELAYARSLGKGVHFLEAEP